MTSSPDLINREALNEEVRAVFSLFDTEEALYRISKAINKAPSVAAEPIVEAHWIYSPCDGVWTTACSHCGYEETGENMRKYMGCPMCRAKMTHIECVGHRKEVERRINSANGFNREAINEAEEEHPTV